MAILPAGVAAQPSHRADIASGFRLLYELKFEEARAVFRAVEKSRPGDPLGPTSEAASYLFQEFNQQGVLTSEFFLNDKRLLEGVEGKPNQTYQAAFLAANQRAQEMAKRRLQADARDTDALFVLAITTGMQADYTGLIEKRHFESLRLTKQAETYARELLKIRPDSQDAYVSLGAANYLIGCLPPHKRFFLWFGGIRGGRREGMRQLEMAATYGDYLRPFAKIMLALAAWREKQTGLSRRLLEELVAEFPQNPLFARELARLKKVAGSAPASR